MASFDFDAAPGFRKAHILTLASGEGWIDSGVNLLIFGQSGTGKSHVLADTPHKLDEFDLICLDDLSYVRKDQVETSVMFELIAHRYERRSIAITASQPFSTWDQVFPGPAMTVAAIDRLVHHNPPKRIGAGGSSTSDKLKAAHLSRLVPGARPPPLSNPFWADDCVAPAAFGNNHKISAIYPEYWTTTTLD